MGVRRADGFTRYALSVQYHGAHILGSAYQGPHVEGCVLPDGTDHRGLRTVAGRIRGALAALAGDGNHENFQLSSRTDRGVHALRNTCHVDVRPRRWGGGCAVLGVWDPLSLRRGLNYHLARQCLDDWTGGRKRLRPTSHGDGSPEWLLSRRAESCRAELRVLSVAAAPLKAPNQFYTGEGGFDEPPEVDWNARFSATGRAYVYRILHMTGGERDFFVPFEYDRSWIIDRGQLDVSKMNEAARYMVGTCDFTSFRGSGCQKASPVVTIKEVLIRSVPYGAGSYLGLPVAGSNYSLENHEPNLVTVLVSGESFLYRQVRNMVGCLVRVGMGKIEPHRVRDILDTRDRASAPAMAPAHGLYLANVEHGDFKF